MTRSGSPIATGGHFAEFGEADAEGNPTTEGSGAEGLIKKAFRPLRRPIRALYFDRTLKEELP